MAVPFPVTRQTPFATIEPSGLISRHSPFSLRIRSTSQFGFTHFPTNRCWYSTRFFVGTLLGPTCFRSAKFAGCLEGE